MIKISLIVCKTIGKSAITKHDKREYTKNVHSLYNHLLLKQDIFSKQIHLKKERNFLSISSFP